MKNAVFTIYMNARGTVHIYTADAELKELEREHIPGARLYAEMDKITFVANNHYGRGVLFEIG